MRVAFDGFEFDTEKFTLTHNGEIVPMEPQVFDVLAHLILHRDRLVPKEELLDEVWGDRFVSESALTSRIKAVRQALGDDGSAQRMVQTTRGRGYRFIAATSNIEPITDDPPPSSARRRTNLPTAPSRLIGRDAVVADVRRALTEYRLVTLTAAGGTGKTRLALAIGEAELATRPGGVWFVDLTAIDDDALVPEAIAGAIGLVLAGGDPTQQVVDYLADQAALLILDNCEHLVAACADFAEVFLSRPGSSRILATTREFLDLDGERAIRLPPLDVDGEQSPAVELFTERAAMVDATLTMNDDELSIIAELCRHLDGSPLAIELAAARANVMSPAQLLAGIGQRFELLRGSRRRRSQHALEDTLDWSYRLLDDDEQQVLRTLGIFVGSFDLEAVVSVADRSRAFAIDVMDSLIAKSLVVSEREANSVRFRLLETTAAYAQRALLETGEIEDVGTRHLDHYLGVCAPFDVGLWASSLPKSVAADRDNFRAAIKWAGNAGRWADAARLTFSTSTALQTQPDDLMDLATDCLNHLGNADVFTTLGLHCVRIYTSIQYDFAEPSAAAAELERSTDPYESALGSAWRGYFEFHFDAPEVCMATFEKNVLQLAEFPDGAAVCQLRAMADVITGWAKANAGRHRDALDLQRQAQRHLETYAPKTTLFVEALASEGIALVQLDDPSAALAVADRLDHMDYLYFRGDEVYPVALVALGRIDDALPSIRDHAADGVTGRLSRKANNSLLLLALLAGAEGDDNLARQLLMSAEHVRNPLISLSLQLADRLDITDAFNRACAASRPDQRASGRRAIGVLRREMQRRGWAADATG